MFKIDEYFPSYDFSESHKILIKCTPQKAYETLITLDFSKSVIIRCLFWLRGLNSKNVQDLRERFTLLNKEPGKEIVLGLIARPWKMKGEKVHLSKEDFQSFSEPDYAKIGWNFTFEHQNENETLVTTETRILCTDIKSRKKFRMYWFFIRPFSGFIRREILRTLRKNLED